MNDMSRLDYQQLRVFDTLLEERSVTKTANRLQMTQPTVSAVLKKLRGQFNDPLFIRSRRGVVPTAKAESMATEIRQILDRMDALGAETEFDPDREPRRFSIAARDFGQRTIIAPLAQSISRRHPKIQLSIHTMSMSKAVDRMARATIDLAVMSLRFAPSNIQQQRILSDPYCCVVDANSKLAVKSSLTVEDLEAHEHISAAAFSIALGDPFSEFFEAAGIDRTVRYAADGFLLIPHLLQGTECIGVIPESLYRCMLEPLRAFPMPVPFPTLNMGMLWNQRVENESGNRWLREQVVDICAEIEDSREPVA